PWVTPTCVAANVYSMPGRFPARVVARPSGETEITEGFRADLSGVELLARWRGTFAVIDESGPLSHEAMLKRATDMFGRLPIRFLTERGVTLRENLSVSLEDDWPATIPIRGFRDLGVICAFLFENAVANGAGSSAVAFRKMIRATTPGTEMLVMYRDALLFASTNLRPQVDARAKDVLDGALRAVAKGLSRN